MFTHPTSNLYHYRNKIKFNKNILSNFLQLKLFIVHLRAKSFCSLVALCNK